FLDYSTKSGSRQTVTSLDGAAYRFGDRFSVSVKPSEGVRRQMAGGELANRDVSRTFAADNSRQSVTLKLGQEQIGVLSKERTGSNAFRVGFESRNVDLAQAAAARASTGRGLLSQRLAREPQFDGVIEVVGKNGATTTYARFGRSGEWIEFGADARTDITIA